MSQKHWMETDDSFKDNYLEIKNKQYYLFYSCENFQNQQNRCLDKDNDKDSKRVIRYRRISDENDEPVDDLVIITEACAVTKDKTKEDFLKSFYEKDHNKDKKFLGIGRWASSLPN